MLKSLAVGVAVVLIVGILARPDGDGTDEDRAGRPAAPAMLAARSSSPVEAGDGLVRLIVTPTGAPDGVGPSINDRDGDATDDGRNGSLGATDGVSTWTIDGGRGQLVLVDGDLMLRDASGALVPAAATGLDREPGAVEEPAAVIFGHPAIDALARRPGVETITSIGDGSFAIAVTDPSVLDDVPVIVTEDTPLALFADPYESYQWALENTGTNLNGVSGAPPQSEDADIDVSAAWPVATGDGVVIAVVDSGVDFAHPDLAPNRWTNPGETCGNGIDDDANGYVDDCYGWDFGYEDNQPFNPGAHPHGTHVAGIIAAAAGNGVGVAGVAPDAVIMDLNVGRTTSSGRPSISTSSLARAIRYAADNGADIINLSLGTPPGTPRSAMTTLESAIEYAGERGALVVAAAGNDTTNLDGATAWPASYDFDFVVTVAATAPDETLAFFSNFGSVVDVAAPGHVILSTAPAADGSYLFMSGTSQATPIVAGIAALALDAAPSLSAAELRDAIRASSDRYDTYVGRIPDGLRANAGNLLGGTTPEIGFDDVAVSVTGLVGANDLEPVSAMLDITVPGDEYDEPYTWSATLVAMETDGDYVVIDHAVSVDGVLDLTEDDGSVSLGLTGSGTVQLTTALPQGQYALVLESVPDADPASRLGDAFVAAFAVADGSGSPATTTVPVSTTTVPYPTTTVPVSTTVPPVGSGPVSTTTTVPYPTTTVPVSTTSVPSVSAGEWSVNAVVPAQGTVEAANLVRLNGTFPESTYVWFGTQPGIVVSSSPYTIDVLTPFRATAGVVDIALVPPGSGAVLVVPSGYTFVDDEAPNPSEPGTPTTTVAPIGSEPTPPGSTTTVPYPTTTVPATTVPPAGSGPSPTTTVPPADVPSPPTTAAPSDPGAGPAPTSTTMAPDPDQGPTTTAPPTTRRPRITAGEQVGLSSGLQGRRITADSPLGTVSLCTSEPCALT